MQRYRQVEGTNIARTVTVRGVYIYGIKVNNKLIIRILHCSVW